MNIIDKILTSELFADNPPVLLDIGASGEIHPKWRPIAGYSICVAFDADDREMGYTVKETEGYRKLFVFNKLVTDNTDPEADFFLTKSPYCSSLLPPDHKNISKWNFGDLFQVEKVVRMNTVRLPSALAEIGITKIDWFKTDSQGTDLRLFRSLGEATMDNVLVAEFEPGILDGYLGEDKLWHIMSFMEKRPFWMSDIKICGTQRISRQTVAERFGSSGGQVEMPLKTSPGWGEVTFINSFESRDTMDVRDHLLGWVFAILEDQFGFAMDIARSGHEKFLDPFFLKLSDCARDIITRKYTPEAALAAYGDLEPQGPVTVTDMRDAAARMIASGEIAEAFQLLVQAKSLRKQLQGIDQLRAVCFLHQGKPGEAVVALREELRYFPENAEAKHLYDQIAPAQMPANGIVDAEFLELYGIIEPYSMLGAQRLYSLFLRAKAVCEKDIPGNFVECGVAAGGSSALLSYVIKKYSKRQRFLFAFDSFAGLPAPSSEDSHGGLDAVQMGWGAGTCSAPESSVLAICMRLGCLPIVKPVKGFYEETLPQAKQIVGPIAFMHMDADWYDSMTTILVHLYDQLSHEALVQVDDYGYWEGCKKAFDDYMSSKGITVEMHDIDSCAVWFQKPDDLRPPQAGTDVVRCPLSGSANVRLERSFSPGELADAYQKTLGIEVGRYLNGVEKIDIYRSLDTGYRFYYPLHIAGDTLLYEELQTLPWYYMDWKWEHDMAADRIKPSDLVLEIGCGKGGFLERIQQKGVSCVGLEMNRDAMETARGKGLDVRDASVQSHVSENRGRYDLVCAFQVMEHIPQVGEFLSACLEVLKPGGRLVLSVPNNDALMFQLPDFLAINAPPHHMGLWGINALLSLSKIFPLRLDAVEHEPLQTYHTDFSKQLIRDKLAQRGDSKRAVLPECDALTSEMMELVLEKIPGHTIIAYYTKL